ncbi:MAG: RHS repeat protein [Gammaproteobacteria bacterium]|nr:MAG: RHS repeat protein [Gammaproteobacteria bacterium]
MKIIRKAPKSKIVFIFLCLFVTVNFAHAYDALKLQPAYVWSVDTGLFGAPFAEASGNFASIDEAINYFNQSANARWADCEALVKAPCERLTITGYKSDPNRTSTVNGLPWAYLLTGVRIMLNPPSGFDPNFTVTIARVPVCSNNFFSSASDPSNSNNALYWCPLQEVQEPSPENCSVAAPNVGNPVNVASRDKHETEIDFSTADGVLQLERNYLNQREGWTFGTASKLIDLTGRQTYKQCFSGFTYVAVYDSTTKRGKLVKRPYCHSYEKNLVNEVFVQGSNSSRVRFLEQSTGIFKGESPAYTGELKLIDESLNGGARWALSRPNNTQDLYLPNGFLAKRILASGRALNYTYVNNGISAITDDEGRSLVFNYGSDNKIESVTTPDNQLIKYSYSQDGLLSRVTWPDNTSKTYLYNETGLVSADASRDLRSVALTGKIDELGVRVGSYYYGIDGKVLSTERANGIDKYSFEYKKVTDPLGSIFTYDFVYASSTDKTVLLSSQSQPAGSGCAASTKNLSYTTTGLVSSKTEFNGNVTLYGYGSNDLEDRRVEGLSGSPSTSVLAYGATLPTGARKISTEWHPDWRKEKRIAEPKKITTNIYNGQPDPFNSGAIASCAPSTVTAPLLCKKVEQATTDVNGANGFGATLDTTIAKREWRFTYNEIGKPLTVITPQSILTNTIESQYEYYSADSTSWKKGDLKQIKNALGHITQYIAYDANGRLLDMINSNGVHQTFTYDLRGRLLTSKLGSDETKYAYDLAGNLTKVTSPDGSEINNTYDVAHRLISVSDKFGNKIEYTLDNAGNTTNTIIRDASGVLRYQQQKVYDALSRVQKTIDTQSHETTYLYDANGNPTGITDPKQHSTNHQFDALDQLKQTTDALNGKTEYSYDGQGNVKSVKDPRGNSTTYNYNAFGDLTSLISPDTGTTTFTYDTAGNRTSATDARGVVVNYTYDALNRLKKVTYPASTSENITYAYDNTGNGSYGIGRLSLIATGSTRNDYVYNYQGLIVKKFAQVESTLSTTQYSYDTAGNLVTMTYPSGRTVTYSRDAAGRIQGITTKAANANATVQTIASNMTYLPFGPAASYAYGNGLTHTNTFDTDYRLTNIQVGGVLSRGYTYDLADNISGISDGKASSKNQTLGYDELDRLTSAQGIYGTLGYTYDSVGNRLTETAAGTMATYTYETTSNRLSSIAKTNANRSFLYDVAGNRIQGTSDALKVQNYTYNNANRLSTLKESGSLVATYKYNALGQRVSKLLASQVQELYHYDEAGHLIAVTDASGITTREYIYSGDELLGFVTGQSKAIPTTTITATTNQATLQNAVLSTTYVGYTGTSGYIQFNGEGQASWPVTITSTANHTIQISYALASGTRPIDVYVDGVKKATVSFASTTAWTKWTAASITLNLTAGNHTFMLKTSGSSGPNLDRIRFTPVAGQTTGTATLYYVHNDHKRTPQVVTAQNQSVVWFADYQPFGKLQPNQSNSIELYSRFPGQYVDQESGIYYNYFRDYDPSIGRYIESDPIGLEGGINTYAYVEGNPLSLIDPLGLTGRGGSNANTVGSKNNQSSCECDSSDDDGGGLSAQASLQGAIHVAVVGVSVSGGGAAGAGTSGAGVCGFVQVCGRFGPGAYVGAGLGLGVSAYSGRLSKSGGLSVGVGGDIGTGASVGGQVTVGVDGGGVNSVGAATGHGGFGGGASVGVDVCWTEMRCNEKCQK